MFFYIRFLGDCSFTRVLGMFIYFSYSFDVVVIM